jgi:hypothetical protein
MPDYTPALTLWPEWAWAIDLPHQLAKRVENRGYALPVGVWIYLHAGKHIGGRPGRPSLESGLRAVEHMARAAGLKAATFLDYSDGGAIAVDRHVHSFGAAEINPLTPGSERRPIITSAILGRFRVLRVLPPGLTEICDGVRGWKVLDSYGNVFEYRRLNQPIPCKGAQGLWKPPVEVQMEIANVGFEVTP